MIEKERPITSGDRASVDRAVRLGALVVLAGFAVAWAACVEDFKPASELGDHIQVLCLRTEPPQAHPGDEVTVQSLVYVPQEAPAPLDSLWLSCVPAVGEGAQTCLSVVFSQVLSSISGCEEQCASDPDPETCMEICAAEGFLEFSCDPSERQKGCLLGTGTELSYEIPDWIREDAKEDEPKTIYLFMMATALEGGLATCFDTWGEQAATGGTVSPTESCTLSLKELDVVNEETELPENPTVFSLSLEGEQLPPPPDVQVVQLPGPNPGSKKLLVEFELSISEDLDGYISWFSDCGKLESTKTFFNDNRNKLKPDKTGVCSIFAMIRDTVAGQSWIERRVDLRL